MKLWFHADSEALFWSDEWDGLSEDATHSSVMRERAAELGIKEPYNANGYDINQDPDYIAGRIAHPLGKPVTAERTFANAVITSMKKWERKPSDLYPTPVDGTESIIEVLKAMKRPDGTPIKTIWEPACGDGRLARVLEWHGFTVISTDLREYPGYGHGGLDFLNDDPTEKWGLDMSEVDAVVTNPPFSLAEEFIRRALSFTSNVVMLLKQTYWNVGGRSQGLWKDHMPDMELKLTWRLAFLASERGNSPLMDCMWAVWCGDNEAVKNGQPRTGLDLLRDTEICIAEPIPRKRYPGYGGIGIMPAIQVLEGEMDALADAMWKLLPDV